MGSARDALPAHPPRRSSRRRPATSATTGARGPSPARTVGDRQQEDDERDGQHDRAGDVEAGREPRGPPERVVAATATMASTSSAA